MASRTARTAPSSTAIPHRRPTDRADLAHPRQPPRRPPTRRLSLVASLRCRALPRRHPARPRLPRSARPKRLRVRPRARRRSSRRGALSKRARRRRLRRRSIRVARHHRTTATARLRALAMARHRARAMAQPRVLVRLPDTPTTSLPPQRTQPRATAARLRRRMRSPHPCSRRRPSQRWRSARRAPWLRPEQQQGQRLVASAAAARAPSPRRPRTARLRVPAPTARSRPGRASTAT
mmetsp:Transcript_5873/g.17454  ORF Transcript_5873/g.17454 Transcript_5873/m.17454 type:complete len:236 (+) Transcript_5873:166-873(+)